MERVEKRRRKQFSLKTFLIVGIICTILTFFGDQWFFFKSINQTKSISPLQATFLISYFANSQGKLYLNGLTKLDTATAKALAQFKGKLFP